MLALRNTDKSTVSGAGGYVNSPFHCRDVDICVKPHIQSSFGPSIKQARKLVTAPSEEFFPLHHASAS